MHDFLINSRFPDIGYERNKRTYLSTNLSKVFGFSLVDFFFLIDDNILAYHNRET
jgi:hypothetical protein